MCCMCCIFEFDALGKELASHVSGLARMLFSLAGQSVAIYEGIVELSGAGTGAAVLLLCFCLLYTSPSPRDRQKSRMPSSA